MNNFISGLILLVCFLVIANAYIPYLSPIRFRNIVIFGDSTSDTGNVFALTDKTYPIPPYYWKGRFCNGPNWVDQLEVLGISNYAYGSATTDNNLVTGYTKGNTIPVPGMLQQIETYLSRNPVKWIDFSRTLYVIYGGPNDFIYNNTLLPNVIITSLLKGVELLLSVGAKNIIIFNIPPVQYYPFTRPYNNASLFTALGTYANIALTDYLGQIQATYPNATLNIFNLNAFVTKLVAKPTSYLTDVTDNCWVLYNATAVEVLCPNPEKYLFLDTFHFTTRAQGLLAAAFRPFLDYSYENNNANCYVLPA